MEAKKKLYELNIMENKKAVWGVNIGAILLFVPFVVLFGLVAVTMLDIEATEGQFHFMGVLLGYLLLIGIHEGIHGLFFKIFCPENPVKYGVKWKSGMAYATSPGSLYSRWQMVVISLAPFYMISIGLTVAAMLGWLDATSYLLLASMHGASCMGDFYYGYLLLAKFSKANILVEDTKNGLMIYQV